MRTLLLFVLLVLGACNARIFIDQSPGSSGDSLALGEATNFLFFTNQAAAESGVSLASGGSYQLKLNLLSNWIDGDIDRNENGELLDERGFANSLMPINVLSRLKRSRQHQWFELMLYQGGCVRDSLVGVSELSYDETANTYTYDAACRGDLKLFVNDSQGFYGNNTGFANVIITRIN